MKNIKCVMLLYHWISEENEDDLHVCEILFTLMKRLKKAIDMWFLRKIKHSGPTKIANDECLTKKKQLFTKKKKKEK